MKKLLLVLIGILVLSLAVMPQTKVVKVPKQVPMKRGIIKVIQPNGGEIWTIGNNFRVKWEASGNFVYIKVYLFVYPSGPEWYLGSVPASNPKNLKYAYQILPKFGGYQQYKIRMVASSNSAIKDESDNPFYIKRPPLPKHLVRLKFISFLYPKLRDRRCWERDREYIVRIDVKGSDEVKLKLEAVGPGGTIAPSPVTVKPPRIVNIPVTIPSNFALGLYKLSAYNMNKPEHKDKSAVDVRKRCK